MQIRHSREPRNYIKLLTGSQPRQEVAVTLFQEFASALGSRIIGLEGLRQEHACLSVRKCVMMRGGRSYDGRNPREFVDLSFSWDVSKFQNG